jgi:glutamyl-tRNA synthetase
MTGSFRAAFDQFVREEGTRCRVRLAPTPSGFLHAGNALNFILNCLAARLAPEGSVLLRIDDLDAARTRPEYLDDIFDSLHWMGLTWDEGPVSTVDFTDHWSQKHRLGLYHQFLDRLRATGLLFACAKSRTELAAFHGEYPAAFRDQGLSLDDEAVAWRIRTPEGFPLPDFIVRKRDGLPAYQLSSLADDVHYGTTHIIRGADLEASTAAQRFLAGILGEEAFLAIHFLHHPLVTDTAGMKLSKSADAESLRARRQQGFDPSALFALAAMQLDLPSESCPGLNTLMKKLRDSANI